MRTIKNELREATARLNQVMADAYNAVIEGLNPRIYCGDCSGLAETKKVLDTDSVVE